MDSLLQTLVTQLDQDDTLALSLTGSYARGDALRYSDVDVWRFVRNMPDDPFAEYTLYEHESHLISVSLKTFAGLRQALNEPQRALFAIPGVRQTRILLDKTGELAQLIEEAKQFQWESLQAQADREASYQLYGLAEEVHKLMNGLAQTDDQLLIYGLYGLIINLTHAVALHRGVLVLSENNYFRQTQQAIGSDSAWTREHQIALGLAVASPAMRARAGLRLYRETAVLLDAIILPEHRPVVDDTLKQITRLVG